MLNNGHQSSIKDEYPMTPTAGLSKQQQMMLMNNQQSTTQSSSSNMMMTIKGPQQQQHHHQQQQQPGCSNVLSVPPPPPMQQQHAMLQQKTQMWIHSNSHFGDSGVQSMSQSTAPSIMSAVSSVQDEFTVHTDLTASQQLKFENIPANFSQPYLGAGAGADSVDSNAIANAIPELIRLLADCDEVVVEQAAVMVHRFAKSEAQQFASVVQNTDLVMALREVIRTRQRLETIKPALGALFQISINNDGLENMKQVVTLTNGEFISDLLNSLISDASFKYALMTLHTLLQERQQGPAVTEYVRRANGMRAIVMRIEGDNEKLLHVAVDCARILYASNQNEKLNFLHLDGPAKLVNILRRFQYEHLLVKTTQALLQLLSCNQCALAITDAGGIDVLHMRLDHPSQRLILASLECLRNLSDVPTGDRDMSQLLTKLLQLLGVNDADVVLFCVCIISNIIANNRRNKEFLMQKDAVSSLIRVLYFAHNRQYVIGTNKRQPHERNDAARRDHQQERYVTVIEEIQERALATLRHLCVGHSRLAEVQLAVMQSQGSPAELYLLKLFEMRAPVLKQTLSVLNKAVAQDSNLSLFVNTKIVCERAPDEQIEIGYVQQIIKVLQSACMNLPTTTLVEDVKVTDLIWLAMSTLQQMCRDERLLEQIVFYLRKSDNLPSNLDGNNYPFSSIPILPIYALMQHIMIDENVQRSALGLLAELASHPEIAHMLGHDTSLMTAFEHFSVSVNQALATYANNLIQKIRLFFHQRQQQSFLYNTASNSRLSNNSQREDLYSADPAWPDDLIPMAMGDDMTFADVFVQQLQHQQRSQSNVPSYDPSPMMDSMHLGSPASMHMDSPVSSNVGVNKCRIGNNTQSTSVGYQQHAPNSSSSSSLFINNSQLQLPHGF